MPANFLVVYVEYQATLPAVVNFFPVLPRNPPAGLFVSGQSAADLVSDAVQGHRIGQVELFLGHGGAAMFSEGICSLLQTVRIVCRTTRGA